MSTGPDVARAVARIAPASPRGPDATALLEELSAALQELTGGSGKASFDAGDAEAPHGGFLIAYDAAGSPLGCGAFRRLGPDICEIKRMYARPGTLHAGRSILQALERAAADAGYRSAWLETRAVNRRAVDFYRRNGYEQIANFGRYAGRPEAVCFGKKLV